jgi:hypothetical protein
MQVAVIAMEILGVARRLGGRVIWVAGWVLASNLSHGSV